MEKVYQVLHILRNYLRCFDRDNAKISEVLPTTDTTRVLLSLIPECEFLTAGRKKEIDEVFKIRRDGLSKQKKVRLINDIHYAAYLLDPNRCPSNYEEYMPAFKRHAVTYAKSTHILEKDIKAFVSKLKIDFSCIFKMWRKEKGRDIMGIETSSLPHYKGNPLSWWCCGVSETRFESLHKFAVMTLSCSPTGTFVERSFKMQQHLAKNRPSLRREKVAKMMFAKWNITMMQTSGKISKKKFYSSLQETALIVQEYEKNFKFYSS